MYIVNIYVNHIINNAHTEPTSGFNSNCTVNNIGLIVEVLCTCNKSIQVILQRFDEVLMKYIHTFSGNCNMLVSYNLISNGTYWVTTFNENTEGIFEREILYSDILLTSYEIVSVSTEINVTTNGANEIIRKL